MELSDFFRELSAETDLLAGAGWNNLLILLCLINCILNYIDYNTE